jgi:hypothetical protein
VISFAAALWVATRSIKVGASCVLVFFQLIGFAEILTCVH